MLYGIALAFASYAVYAVSDACVKFLNGSVSPYETVCIGSILALSALPFIKKPGDVWSDMFRTSNRPLWLMRTVNSAIGTLGSVIAFTHLSMAEAFAILFLMPTFVTILSVVFLKEQVGWRRWLAVIIGFAGVLIILRPGFRALSVGHFGALVSSFCGAISIVVYRAMGKHEKRMSLYLSSMAGPIVIGGALMLPSFQAPTAQEWVYLTGYGLLAAGGGVLLMLAAQNAPASAIASPQYSQMIWALLFGYFVFDDHIDKPMIAGIALIIVSGLFTLMRERQRGVEGPPTVAASEPAAALVEDATE